MNIEKLGLTKYEGRDVLLEDEKLVLVQIGTSFFELVPHFLDLPQDEAFAIIKSDLYSLELLKED